MTKEDARQEIQDIRHFIQMQHNFASMWRQNNAIDVERGEYPETNVAIDPYYYQRLAELENIVNA